METMQAAFQKERVEAGMEAGIFNWRAYHVWQLEERLKS